MIDALAVVSTFGQFGGLAFKKLMVC